MKILLCLTTIICTCNGGISSAYGGNLFSEIEIEPQQLQHLHEVQLVEQGNHNNAPSGAPVEIINIQSDGNGAGYGGDGVEGGHSGGYQSEWQPLTDVHSYNSEPAQIIKIIHEHQAHDSHGRHGGHGFGGQSQPQIIKIIEEQSYDNHHGNNGGSFQPHQIVKIIEEQVHGGHEHGGNSFEHHNFGGHGSHSQAEPAIIFADPPSIPSIPFIPSTGTSSKSNSNPLSSLGSIFPTLLRLLFGGGNSQPSLPSLGGHGHGSKAINTPNAGQLINGYGYGGTTKITKAGKFPNSFYKSGRVIESGTLKISSVKKGGKW